ncbi:vacuolar protein sorting-associated protein 13A-like, partial [Tropilaelaps mercedesae]
MATLPNAMLHAAFIRFAVLYLEIAVFLIAAAYAARYNPVPVVPFNNLCALTPQRLNEFLNCTLSSASNDGRMNIVHDFKKQTSAFGDLTMGEVVRMACRSIGDDGEAAMREYLEALETQDDQLYMLNKMHTCGGP